MKHPLPSLLSALALAVGLSGAALGASSDPSTAGADATGRIESPAFVDSTDILYMESWPVQVRLVVQGSVPTPCHEPVWDVQTSADGIAVKLWSEADADAVCASVLAPFEVSIPLGSYETADLPVTLNGEEIGRVVVGEAIAPPLPGDGDQLTGAGWSFGMCAGTCRADLVLDRDDLVLTGSDPAGAPLIETRATLTAEGRAALDAALAALGDTPLEPQYGCPDCADGGATYLVLARDGESTRHDMEFGNPPPELAGLAALSSALIDAMRACRSDELVSVGDDCVAWPA
jgi:hypothetical protein